MIDYKDILLNNLIDIEELVAVLDDENVDEELQLFILEELMDDFDYN